MTAMDSKPVAWMWNQGGVMFRTAAPDDYNAWKWTPLYAHPAARNPGAWMTEAALKINRLILAAALKGGQAGDCDEFERITDKDIDTLEAELLAHLRAAPPSDTALLKESMETLYEERRVRLLGQEPDIHWEAMRHMRRACYAATDATLAKLRERLA